MPKRDPIASESDRHKKAFELYYAQGEKRSFPRLAKELGVSMAALKVWSKSFSWQSRLRERELETARQIADRTLQTTLSDQERYHKIVRMAVTKLAKAIAEDRVKLQAADLDRLIRLEDYLSHTQGGGAFGAVPTVEDLLHAFARLCSADQDRIMGRLGAPEAVETTPGSG